MRPFFYAAALIASLGSPAEPSAPHACNVSVDVIDQDSHGTHIRDAPGGKIVATLLPSPSSDDWIEVHVAAQQGDWFLVDRADRVGDERKTIYRGKGYMHRSVLGASGLVSGEPVRVDHDPRSASIAGTGDGDQPADLLGCWHDFLQVRLKGGSGWTKKLCLNQRTTCV